MIQYKQLLRDLFHSRVQLKLIKILKMTIKSLSEFISHLKLVEIQLKLLTRHLISGLHTPQQLSIQILNNSLPQISESTLARKLRNSGKLVRLSSDKKTQSLILRKVLQKVSSNCLNRQMRLLASQRVIIYMLDPKPMIT